MDERVMKLCSVVDGERRSAVQSVLSVWAVG